MSEKPVEIDLIDLIKIFLKNKALIIFITSIFAVSSVIYALSLDNIYKSEALLEVSDSSIGGVGGMASQFSGLASLAGIGGIPNVPKDKSAIAFEKLKSKNLAKDLYKYDWIVSGVFAIDYYDKTSQKIIYNDDIYNSTTNKWVRSAEPPFLSKPSYLELHKTLNEGIVSVSKDSKTGLIKLTVAHESPVFAKELVAQMIYEVNESDRLSDLKDSTTSLDYLNKQLQIYAMDDIKNSINELIKTNMEVKMLSSINEYYSIKPIDGPHIPEFKISPVRSIICIAITLIGFALALVASVIREFFYKKKL
jgi:capsular polysaccharide biosynthesis protein